MSSLFRIIPCVIALCISFGIAVAQDIVDPYSDVPKFRTEDGGFVLGDPAADVKLIEFSDFLCPSCQNYEPIISGFIQDYVITGQAQFEYRIFPVVDPTLSAQGANLVECAEVLRPGAFWHAHDMMFDLVIKQGFTEHTATAFADSLALELDDLLACSAEASQYEIDAEYGRSLGVRGTPALFVQYDDSPPLSIALPLTEHYPAIVNAIRPESTEPVTIEFGDYAGLTTFRLEDGGFALGDREAAVTIVAFEDFLCPHCGAYTATVKQFAREQVRAGNANFEFRFYPLVNPQYSTTFAKTAECVAAQDLRLFWDAHDLLFEFAGAGNLDDAPAKLATLLGLDAHSLNECLDRAIQFLVDTQLGQSASVSGTPAIRARAGGGAPQVIYAGQQSYDRGGLPLEMLTALAEGAPGVSIGPPEPTLLNANFLQDTSLIDGEPCAPPCWRNIVPGETDMSVALDLVASEEALNIVQSSDWGFVFQLETGAPCCQVASDNEGRVASILLQLAPRIDIGDVLQVYGEPEFVSGQPFSESEAVIMLLYLERQMALYVVVPGVEGQLEATSPVVSAIYASEDVLARAFGAMPFDRWKGYLKYSEYMDGEFDHEP